MVAFDADGEGAVRDDGIDESGVAEGERNEMDTPAVQAASVSYTHLTLPTKRIV